MSELKLEQILSAYDYDLPDKYIANAAVFPRDHAKLMRVNRQTGNLSDHFFYDLADFLGANDVLVLNETKVFSARLLGKKASGGKVELLLIKQIDLDSFEAISKPGLKLGQRLFFPRRSFTESDASLSEDLEMSDFLQAEVIYRDPDSAKVQVRFNQGGADLLSEIDQCGFTPLPPYIHPTQTEDKLKEEYQTVYAKHLGSAAAPTAGLHFTDQLLDKLREKGVQIEKITLHVGLGTFAKLSMANLEEKRLHEEFYEIKEDVAKRLNQAKQQGKRIIAVGTTSARTLESAVMSRNVHELSNLKGQTSIFITPPFQFAFVDALLTNFHLPQSSLLMMISAFCTSPNTSATFNDFKQTVVGQAYQRAIDHEYRFFSFGDVMLIE
jgi:S-adenosylmethionine:tRNA ribosyltransferase-isomerase